MIGTASAVLSSFIAGLASFFAPCAFPLLPGYIGYYVSEVEGNTSLSGVIVRGLAGSAGILLTFAGISAVVAILGRSVLSSLYVLEPLVGVVLVGLGIFLIIERFPKIVVPLPRRRSSIPGFVLFGSGYAIAATSCFAPIFMAIVFGSTTVSLQQTLISIVAFGVGLAAPLTVTTVVAGIGFDIGASKAPRYAEALSRWAGAIILIAGLWQITRAMPLV